MRFEKNKVLGKFCARWIRRIPKSKVGFRLVLVRFSGSHMTICASNMDGCERITVAGAGAAAAPFGGLIDLPALKAIGTLSKTGFEVNQADNGIRLIGAGVTQFYTFSESDFGPREPAEIENDTLKPFEVTSTDLKWLISAASTDETRPAINGVNFNGSVCASSDGHRLHKLNVSTPRIGTVRLSALETVAEFKNSQCARNIDGNPVFICTDGDSTIEIETDKVDCDFPPIDQVIPKWSADRGLRILRSQIEAIVTAIGKRRDRFGVRLTLKTEGSKWDFCSGDGSQVLSGALDCAQIENETAEGFEIGFNEKYLFDAVMTDSNCMFYGPLDPIKIVAENGRRVSVVMPMRI